MFRISELNVPKYGISSWQGPRRMNRSETYYVLKNGEQMGPFARAQIESMWMTGFFTSDCLYWIEGMEEWKLLREILETPTPPLQSGSPSKFNKVVARIQNLPRGAYYLGLVILLSILIPLGVQIYFSNFTNYSSGIDYYNKNFGTSEPLLSPEQAKELKRKFFIDGTKIDRYAAEMAEADVKNLTKLVGLRFLTNEELDDLADKRWVVFRSSKEWGDIYVPAEVDLLVVKDRWIRHYRAAYTQNIAPLVEAERRNRAPAF